MHLFFFFNDTATTEIYTLSLHDALPISLLVVSQFTLYGDCRKGRRPSFTDAAPPERAERLYERFVARARDGAVRSEEHTSELQSPCNLVCRLLLEKKKKTSRRSARDHAY